MVQTAIEEAVSVEKTLVTEYENGDKLYEVVNVETGEAIGTDYIPVATPEEDAKESARAKLAALGLTEDEVSALIQ